MNLDRTIENIRFELLAIVPLWRQLQRIWIH
jgi:hypothetical protein